MRWMKRGLIFAPRGAPEWMLTHASDPFALPLGGDRFRIFFCSRDARGRAQIGYFEVDLRRPDEVLFLTERPVIGLGPLGSFEDSGVVNACVVQDGARHLHYYSGMTLGVSVPFYFFAALAVSDDGARTFTKTSPSPLLERDAVDPYLTGSPWVLRDGDRWRMWYTSGVRWETVDGRPKHYYHIKYAESRDGFAWERRGRVCIDFASPEEYVFGRPCVVKDADRYRMWYSFRGGTYRLGYAESRDGLTWERRDREVGIDVSEAGWDSEMIAYGHVFDHAGERYLLYNGNGYGKTGIGLAVLAKGP